MNSAGGKVGTTSGLKINARNRMWDKTRSEHDRPTSHPVIDGRPGWVGLPQTPFVIPKELIPAAQRDQRGVNRSC